MSKSKSKQLGAFVAKRRAELGLTLRAVGKAAGVDAATIMRIERGEFETPDPGRLQKLARALAVSVEDLYVLIGYTDGLGLPEFEPYLRAKYNLPDAAVEDLDRYFAKLKSRYGEKGGRRGKRSR